MWGNHIIVQSSQAARRAETLVDALHRPAIPLDDVSPGYAQALPAPQVAQQARRDPDWRLAFLGFAAADRAPVEDARIEVDPALAGGWGERRAADGARPRPISRPNAVSAVCCEQGAQLAAKDPPGQRGSMPQTRGRLGLTC
jgi:hypothetical protein